MDEAQKASDALLESFSRQIAKTYGRAAAETAKEYEEFHKQWVSDIATRQAMVEAGEITYDQYARWLRNKLTQNNRYKLMVETMSRTYVEADQAAAALINGMLPEAYGEAVNYALYLCEDVTGMPLAAGIVDADTVALMIRGIDAFPAPSINIPLDERWNRQHINAELTQGILKGESIPKIAKRLQSVAIMDSNAAMRNARTAMTAAQNIGRLQGFKRAESMGARVMKQWVCTLDNATRHEHALLDGQTVPLDEPFTLNGYALEYPGDPSGEPEMIYNCRCFIRPVLDGIDSDDARVNGTGMSYEEWRAQHAEAILQ